MFSHNTRLRLYACAVALRAGRMQFLVPSFQLHEEERVLRATERRGPGNEAISVSDPSSQPRMRARIVIVACGAAVCLSHHERTARDAFAVTRPQGVRREGRKEERVQRVLLGQRRALRGLLHHRSRGHGALTEYIRGSNVACRVNKDTQYINNYCSGNLPPTQFFPVFIVVHAILIALPHYLWLNLYGDNFDFFFDLALQLKPIKTKGKYEETNFTIVSELDSAFCEGYVEKAKAFNAKISVRRYILPLDLDEKVDTFT